MSKYFSIFKMGLKQEKQTIGNTLLAIFSFFVIVIIFKQLWTFIYTEGGGTIINGYTVNMMMWYLIMAESITFILSTKAVTIAFASDIKSGKIAYSLNKPYNYFNYQIVTNLSGAFWKMTFMVPISVLAGLMLAGGIKNFSFYHVLPILLSLVLATIVSCLIYGIIGLFTFWIEEATPFTWIVQKFVLLLGVFFPPEFFPSFVKPFITYSPIFSMMSGPSKLIANFSWDLFFNLTISQVLYILLFYVLGQFIYSKGTRKVNINGG